MTYRKEGVIHKLWRRGQPKYDHTFIFHAGGFFWNGFGKGKFLGGRNPRALYDNQAYKVIKLLGFLTNIPPHPVFHSQRYHSEVNPLLETWHLH